MPTATKTSPTPLGLAPTFGFGDRLGLATPGHLRALTAMGGPFKGIFAQQSIREMARTERSPEQVMAAAAEILEVADYEDGWSADADHLKTPEDIQRTADAGFVFYTIDPSGEVDQQADDYTADQVDARYQPPPWADRYLGKTIEIEDGPSIPFDELTVKRAAVKYGKAITHALELAEHIRRETEQRGIDHEIEISVDETDQPTTLAEHYIIADQLLTHGVNLVSLAPRFIGQLEKGVDYIGDLGQLAASLEDHAALAAQLGPYKLSLHSGSDKLSMYSLFARATQGRCHVKTAGTSYLEALRVVARHEPALFRRIIDFSRERYDTDRATYHVHAKLDQIASPAAIEDDHELEGVYLGHWDDVPEGRGFTNPGRQILHCTFGSVLTDPTLKDELYRTLREHPDTHLHLLTEHFGRHLAALRAGIG